MKDKYLKFLFSVILCFVCVYIYPESFQADDGTIFNINKNENGEEDLENVEIIYSNGNHFFGIVEKEDSEDAEYIYSDYKPIHGKFDYQDGSTYIGDCSYKQGFSKRRSSSKKRVWRI